MFWGNRVADRCLCSQYMWVDGGRLYGKGQLIIYGTGVLNISMRSDFFLIYYFFFLAVLGFTLLRADFSGCGGQGLLSTCCARVAKLIAVAFLVAEHRL